MKTANDNIAAIVSQRLNRASEEFLAEIVDHGIHNLTNDFNGNSDEDYQAFDDEFRRQAAELLNRSRQLDAFAAKYGEFFTSDGIRVAAKENAWSDNLAGEDCGYAYCARAIDMGGNDYKIIWSVTNPDAESSEDACDWAAYRVVRV